MDATAYEMLRADVRYVLSVDDKRAGVRGRGSGRPAAVADAGEVLAVPCPRRLNAEDYWERYRGYSAVGWLIRWLGDSMGEELECREAVRAEERRLCVLLDVTRAELGGLEAGCAAVADGAARVRYFCGWCGRHGIRVGPQRENYDCGEGGAGRVLQSAPGGVVDAGEPEERRE